MIETTDVTKVIQLLVKDIAGITNNPNNFQKLPDSFWGYYARGHDKKGNFGVIITYSENKTDVDDLIKMYEDWLQKNKNVPKNSSGDYNDNNDNNDK